MRLINHDEIKEQINNCYDSWNPNWKANIGDRSIIPAFKYHLEQAAGLKLDFEIEIRRGISAYKINSIEVVDEEAFMLWILAWA